jgi:purine nucleosidase
VSPVPLILDVDTGVDDALALLYAVASPEVELIAATCVMGNVTVDIVTDNTLAVLELVGRTDVEVARGAAKPLVRDHEPFPIVHGEHGLGRAELPPPTRAPSDRNAARLIVDTVRDRPGEVLLVATGPLTNVALALQAEPRLLELLGGFALMGGAYVAAGNTTPVAEFNVWADPEAASGVFGAVSGARDDRLPACVGLDVTERTKLSQADLDAVCAAAPGSRVARFLQDAVSFYIDFYVRYGRSAGASMHDPLTLAIAIDPSLARFETTRVEVETEGTWTRGETVTDLSGIRHSPWPGDWQPRDNARVALDVDAPAFMQRLQDRLRSLVEAGA